MKTLPLVLTALLCLSLAGIASAEPLEIAPDATIKKLLAGQVGKTVTVKLGGNDELTGKVKAVSDEVLHLSELSGKEYYDAAVKTDDIKAVVIRTK